MVVGSVSNRQTVSIGARTDVVGQVEIWIREGYRRMAIPLAGVRREPVLCTHSQGLA
jgi:hypothetical protein